MAARVLPALLWLLAAAAASSVDYQLEDVFERLGNCQAAFTDVFDIANANTTNCQAFHDLLVCVVDVSQGQCRAAPHPRFTVAQMWRQQTRRRSMRRRPGSWTRRRR